MPVRSWRQLELEHARQLHDKEQEVVAQAQEQTAEQLARVKKQL